MDEVILKVEDLKCHFHTRKGTVKAVDSVSLQVRRGEILALVGESGCGKSVTSQAIMGLIGHKRNEHVEGNIWFNGENLLDKSEEEMRALRGNRLALISQDPMTSLNPAHRIGRQIAEVSEVHERLDRKSAWKKAVDMLRKMGIPSPETRARDYPHQFSGGMRQRGVIGMGLMCEPDLLIADEPTTALDVTIQAQVLDLMRELRDQSGLGIVLITHDLGVVAQICDTVAVMYAGTIVEEAPVKALFAAPHHPYTRGLLASLPRPGKKHRLSPIPGQPPSLTELPRGCRFADRCPQATAQCREAAPPLIEIEQDHRSACWLGGEGRHDKPAD